MVFCIRVFCLPSLGQMLNSDVTMSQDWAEWQRIYPYEQRDLLLDGSIFQTYLTYLTTRISLLFLFQPPAINLPTKWKYPFVFLCHNYYQKKLIYFFLYISKLPSNKVKGHNLLVLKLKSKELNLPHEITQFLVINISLLIIIKILIVGKIIIINIIISHIIIILVQDVYLIWRLVPFRESVIVILKCRGWIYGLSLSLNLIISIIFDYFTASYIIIIP